MIRFQLKYFLFYYLYKNKIIRIQTLIIINNIIIIKYTLYDIKGGSYILKYP